jgi:thioredoxin reductase (NADPH)
MSTKPPFTSLDVVIVGAGPTGISCGIAAKRHGLSFVIIDQGGIADAIRRFPTEMSFYSTASMISLGELPFISAGAKPSRAEALRYYRAVCEFYSLPLQLHTKITQAEKTSNGFELSAVSGQRFQARNVILATGYYDTPNYLGVPGEELSHVHHYYHEPYAYAGCSVVVVGGGNSAVDAALELYRNSARVTLVHRGATLTPGIKYWIGPDFENRCKENSITAHFSSTVEAILSDSVLLRKADTGDTLTVPADAVFLLTGYRASLELVGQLGAECNFSRGEPIHDGNFETSVPGLFCAGSANCGIHTSEIFIENGRTHAERIIPALRV